MITLLTRPCSALSLGAGTVPFLVAFAFALLLTSSDLAVSQDAPRHDDDLMVRQRQQQQAFQRLGMIVNELAEVQALIRPAREELLRANALEQEAIKQALKRDPAGLQLQDRVAFLELRFEHLIQDPRNIEPAFQAEMQGVAKELARARLELTTRGEQLVPNVRRENPQLQAKRQAAQERLDRLRKTGARLNAEWDNCIKEAFGLK